MCISSNISPVEAIGRQVLDSATAKRLLQSAGTKGALPRGQFIPRAGSPTISVDRFLGELGQMTAVGDANAAMRTDGIRIFYGWCITTAGDAEKNGRKVKASPRTAHPANPYHADIHLPIPSEEFYKSNMDVWHKHIARLRNDLIGRVWWQPRQD